MDENRKDFASKEVLIKGVCEMLRRFCFALDLQFLPPAEIVANAEIISMQTILITMERGAAAVSLNQ